MLIPIIVILLYIVGIILFGAAFIAVANKKERNLKKAFIEFGLAILSSCISCFIQYSFNYVISFIPFEIASYDEKNPDGEKINKEIDNVLGPDGEKINKEIDDVLGPDGEKINKEIDDVLGHDYVGSIIEPTCIDQGYTIFTCSRCNDSYLDNYVDAVGHDYNEGVCIQCGYVKEYNSEEIMKILSNSVVSSNEFYSSHVGDDSISVFARDTYNCFSIGTAVSYNMWGNNVQTVIFNITDLNMLETLCFDIGGETGSSGAMKVEFFIDELFENDADYEFELDASDIPISQAINIKGGTALGIRVTNSSGNWNTLVFFNFSGEVE